VYVCVSVRERESVCVCVCTVGVDLAADGGLGVQGVVAAESEEAGAGLLKNEKI
jgi:hypothetical protein